MSPGARWRVLAGFLFSCLEFPVSKSSKNLRAKRRRRLKAESALRRRLACLADECFGLDELLLKSRKETELLRGRVADLRRQVEYASANMEMLLKGRLLVKVVEGSSPFSPGSSMVRVRYRHPDMSVRVPVAVPPEEAFAELGERIARKVGRDPLAAKTVLSLGFAEEFYREFMDDMYGEVVLRSLRQLGDQLASAIFAGVCLASVKLALKLKEESRV